MKYRKKPVIIDAVKWRGQNLIEMKRFLGDSENYHFIDGELYITTLEGTMHAAVGDYVIRGLRDEFYPCKPDVFRKTYEPVRGGKND